MLDLLFRDARLVFPRMGERHGSLGVRDGKIAGIYLDGFSPPARRTVKVGGRALLPGVIDPHIHLGVRGDSYDVECLTETRAALKGGITTVGCYLREEGSYIGRVEDFRRRAEDKIFTDLLFHLVILEPSGIPDIPLLAQRYGNPAFKFYLHGIPGLPVMDAGNLLEALSVIAALRPPGMACVHAENSAMCAQGMAKLREGNPSTLADWTESSPDGAEAEAVRLCAFAAQKTQAHVYIVHLSSAWGLEAVREAKASGVPLHCESTSTYLFYDDADPAGMKLRRHPPIRTAADRDALWTGVEDGSIETLGTDNVTASAEENNFAGSFWGNRGGMPCLSAHVPQILHRGHHERGLPSWLLADRMCRRPAELFGLYPRKGVLRVGADADLVVADLDLEKRYRAADSGSRSDFSPLEGRKLRGWPVTVVKGGEIAVEEGKLVCDPGSGRCLN
ncbi:MAG: dihydroorotase family protein [Nitrospinota bacterium]